jgi:hypothetical protein
MAATIEVPPSMGGTNSSSEAQQKQIPSVASYILTWGKATGAVLVRFGRLEKEIDAKELSHAVEAMKVTLNDCNLLCNLLWSLSEVKREDMSPTTRQELPGNPLLLEDILNNKRPGTPIPEGIQTNKRARLAQEHDNRARLAQEHDNRAQPAKRHDNSTLEKTVVSPIWKVLNEVYPRSGKHTLEDRQSCVLTWDNEASVLPDSTIMNAPNRTFQRKAEELAYLLNAGASGDAVQAAGTLVRMLNRADMAHIRQNVQYMLGPEYHQLNVDRVITDGLVKFIWHHQTKGQQSKDVQNAIDAILTAACFALPGEEASLSNIASRILDIDEASGKLTRHKKKALEMIASQASFSPKERKTRADSYREEAACCVSDFCHSEESLRLDTE